MSRIALIVLSVAVVVTLTACGKKSESTSSTAAEPSEGSVAKGESAVQETVAVAEAVVEEGAAAVDEATKTAEGSAEEGAAVVEETVEKAEDVEVAAEEIKGAADTTVPMPE